jgi:hypothetical protein
MAFVAATIKRNFSPSKTGTHTENPEAYQKSLSNVTLIKESEKYFL